MYAEGLGLAECCDCLWLAICGEGLGLASSVVGLGLGLWLVFMYAESIEYILIHVCIYHFPIH